ncbi:pentatricopeptide repeat-containing protein At3g51320-like [Chenopodium quinoa]|uniref:pentatricopeptide repeat-containing protein At3g51320-like n=1 Tax=Chenopodium quinoa TaxID=63459 RepID=UPI000B77D1E6|nr:pentatricopeptide repeat-containing protein At3g51320-like [Chenopodium quinoa]
MARALIRDISCVFLPAFRCNYSSSTINLPLSHQILTCLNSQWLKKNKIKELYAILITSGRVKIPFFGCKLLKFSFQFGDLRDALWVFHSIDFPNIVCVNNVIKAYSGSCLPLEGVRFYFEMLKSGVFPNSYTFPPLLNCCAKEGSSRIGEMCHSQVIKNGFDGVVQIQSSLIHMYDCCGVNEVALKVFDVMPERDLMSCSDGFVKDGDFSDIVYFNNAIKAYSGSILPLKGLRIYFEMLKSGVFPNSYTFPPLLNCCAKEGSSRIGEMCHGQVIKNGFDGVMHIQSSLINMYACCGVIEVALKVFDLMLERDVVSWNSICDGFVKVGNLRTAHNLFDSMPERNVVSWNIMMTGYLERLNPGYVLILYRQMRESGLLENDTTMVNVLAACGRSARWKEGASVHGFLVRRLWNLSLIMNTALIDMYSKCKKVEVARSIFDGLLQRNLVCWNSMILGHCLNGNPNDGIHLFEDMIYKMKLDVEAVGHRYVHVGGRHRVLPDEITYVGVICACTRAGLLEEGRFYFDQMENLFGIKPNFAHYWCMANLLASKGLVQEALDTVKKVNEFVVDVSSESLLWASLFGSCRFQGDLSIAEQVAKTLIELEPQNTMCYALLLNIYAAAGRWEDADEVKELMYKREAGKVYGGSLVDLIEIVHNFRLGDGKEYALEITKLVIGGEAVDVQESKTECQT